MFEIYPHIFNNIQIWGLWWPFIHLSWRYLMVDFEVSFGSLSCWNTQPLFNFNVWRLSFGFVNPKHIFPKGFRLLNVFFCIFCMLNFVLKSFFLAIMPCRSLFFKVCCIVVLGTARPVFATLSCSSFTVYVLLSIDRKVSGHSIWNLFWSSRPCLDLTVPFIFHFLIMFLTVVIGSLGFCSLILLGGNYPSFWNPWTTV